MKFIGFDREEEAINWAASRLDTGNVGFCRAISAVKEDNSFAFVVVLSNFSSTNIDVNVAGSPDGKWMRRGEFAKMFNFVFTYVFDHLKAVRVTGLIQRGNMRARKLVRGVGFKPEGRMRKAFKNDDLCIYGLLAEDFKAHRWYRRPHGT